MEKTRLSQKGQVVIPQKIRARYGWDAGVEFAVEDRGEDIVLKPIKTFPETTLDEVWGCLAYQGPSKSLQEMEEGIRKGARRQR